LLWAASAAGAAILPGCCKKEIGGRLEISVKRERPELEFGKYVENPVPLRAFTAIPCKNPRIKETMEWEELYGEPTLISRELENAIVTVWADWCAPCRAELGFFERLNRWADAPVVGIEWRENKEDGKPLEETWWGPPTSGPLMVVKMQDLKFPQFAMQEKDIVQTQYDAGVPMGEEHYPFNAILLGGRIVYYTDSVWHDAMERPGDAGAQVRIWGMEEEYPRRRAEFLSVIGHFFGWKK
jgi:thiol-disulfide isomerase/thioredoxin